MPKNNQGGSRDESEDNLRIVALDYAWRTLSSQPGPGQTYSKAEVLSIAQEYFDFLIGTAQKAA
jgi:hypothetical protein